MKQFEKAEKVLKQGLKQDDKSKKTIWSMISMIFCLAYAHMKTSSLSNNTVNTDILKLRDISGPANRATKGARRQVQGSALVPPWILIFSLFAEHYSCTESDTETPSVFFYRVKYGSGYWCSTSRH